MRALVLASPGRVEIHEISVPNCKRGELLLRVGMVGLCGGDLNGYRGTFGLQEYPVILGHEIGATIEAVGADVPEVFKCGQRVTVNPYLSCKLCVACRRNRPNACVDNRTMGVRRPGAMTPLIAVPWEAVQLAEMLSLKALALVEPLAVGFHAARRGRITADDSVVVIGCGVVGLGAVHAAARAGASVIAVDIDDKKLDVARKVGAQTTINSRDADLHTELLAITGRAGPDAVIEAVGNSTTFRLAVDEVAFTGRVVYVGYAKNPVEYKSQTFVQKELDIMGSRNSLGEFSEVIAALESGRFPFEEVISKIVTLDDAGAALAEWSDNPGKYTKIMVDLTAEHAP